MTDPATAIKTQHRSPQEHIDANEQEDGTPKQIRKQQLIYCFGTHRSTREVLDFLVPHARLVRLCGRFRKVPGGSGCYSPRVILMLVDGMLTAVRAQRTRAKLNSHQSIFSDGEKPSEREREVSNTAWVYECACVL